MANAPVLERSGNTGGHFAEAAGGSLQLAANGGRLESLPHERQ